MDRLPSSNRSSIFPVGLKFVPTDEHYVAWYLRKKAFSRKNDHVVPEFDVFQTEPNNLPRGDEAFLGVRYFFLNLKDRVFEDVDNRNAGSGQWRTEGEVKNVVIRRNKLVGRRYKLGFWMNNGTEFVQTKWVMYEYRIFFPSTASSPPQMSSWAAYKIFEEKDETNQRANVYSWETSDRDDYSEDEELEDDDWENEEEEDVERCEVNFADESGTNTGPPSPSSSGFSFSYQ